MQEREHHTDVMQPNPESTTANSKLSIKSHSFLKKMPIPILIVLSLVTLLFIFLLWHSISKQTGKTVIIIFIVALSISAVSTIAFSLSIILNRLNSKWVNAASNSTGTYRSKLEQIINRKHASDLADPDTFEVEISESTENMLSSHPEWFTSLDGNLSECSKRISSLSSDAISYIRKPESAQTNVPTSFLYSKSNSDLDVFRNETIEQIDRVCNHCDISIKQNNTIVSVAIVSFVLGIILLAISIVLPMVTDKEIDGTLITTIGTVITNLISLVLFVLYKNVSKQISLDKVMISDLLNRLNPSCMLDDYSSSKERDKMLTKIINESLKASKMYLDYFRNIT